MRRLRNHFMYSYRALALQVCGGPDLYALIRKLSGSGFLYLKLLGVDVYELAKADAPQAEPKEEDAHNIGSASGSQVDPICL